MALFKMMNLPRTLILASKSPRRQELLRTAGFDFVVKTADITESFPGNLSPEEAAIFIAKEKSKFLQPYWKDNIVLAADTIVVLDNEILGKPSTASEAQEMLAKLSGRQHSVITGVSISTDYRSENFGDSTTVVFKKLQDHEIDYYIQQYQPIDKAGAYGIQEWIGMIGIEKIQGSYFNVVGLPVHRVYQELQKFKH